MTRRVRQAILEELLVHQHLALACHTVTQDLVEAAADALSGLLLDEGFRLTSWYRDGHSIVQCYANPWTGVCLDELTFTLWVSEGDHGRELFPCLRLQRQATSPGFGTAQRVRGSWYLPFLDETTSAHLIRVVTEHSRNNRFGLAAAA